MFSILSNIKAEKDDSVEDTGNGTEKENTGGEEGEEDEEGEGEDVDEEEDEDVRKQISSLSVRGEGEGNSTKFYTVRLCPKVQPRQKRYAYHIIEKRCIFHKTTSLHPFLNPWNEVKEQYYGRTSNIARYSHVVRLFESFN